MPTYEYVCTAGHTFEAFQKISERPKSKCPICGKSAKRKISGGAGLVFKGSGFYITDYGKDGKGPRKDGGDAAAATSPAPKPDATSEAKPAEAKKDKKPKAAK
ncbi:MAG TPA: zinc ribbon domain-containing protein [Gemmatimonadales bacterium]|nr:zinc ribbon domain-containing protein [Gemmatimonadales bacterium]